MDATTAAAAAAADADTTLDFDPVVLKQLYDYASPYIVGVADSSGVVYQSTSIYDLVLVHPYTIEVDCPDSVVYHSTSEVARVDAVAVLAKDVAILFAHRGRKPPLPATIFAPLDEHDGVSEKVVSFFPAMESVAMFKGHIVMKDARSRAIGDAEEKGFENSSNATFCCTSPYAYTSSITPKEKDLYEHELELGETRTWTLGAPVFNLSRHLVGTISDVGTDYNIKFAKNARYLQEVLEGLWAPNVNWLKRDERIFEI